MNLPLISQNPIDGRWEARFDGIELASMDYGKLENAISELVNWRAQKQIAEDSLDAMEQQRSYDRELTLEVYGVWGLVVALALVLGLVAYFVG